MFVGSAASAEDFDWHNEANRLQIATIFEGTARACVGVFGFTRLPTLPKTEMAEKIDAYLLLRDDPQRDLGNWLAVFKPALELVSDKPGVATVADDRRGGAALVAAMKDPSLMKEAEQQYVDGAMGPYRRALDACSLGERDSFLGKNYWTGTGSTDDIEKRFRDGFAKAVEELKAEHSTRKPAKG